MADEPGGVDTPWEGHQRAVSIHFRATRRILLNKALMAAREGLLTHDWRNRLAIGSDHNRRAILGDRVDLVSRRYSHQDSDTLVLHEIVTMPTQLWEPYAANGDWRASLNAWHSAWLALDEERITDEAGPPAGSTPVMVEIYRQIAHKEPMGYEFIRDHIGASYRAGLAAGGDDVDWETWLQERHALRPAESYSAAGSVDWPGLRRLLQQLPTYWTTSV